MNFTDLNSLESICLHYELEVPFKEKTVLIAKIEKANLLVFDKKPPVIAKKKTKPVLSQGGINSNKSISKKPPIKSSQKNNKKSKNKDQSAIQEQSQSAKKKGFSFKKLFSKLTS